MHRVLPTDTNANVSDRAASSWLRNSRRYGALRFVAASFALVMAIGTMGCPSGKETVAATNNADLPAPRPDTAIGEQEKAPGSKVKRDPAEVERSRKEVAEEDRKEREELAAIEKLPAAERAARMKELQDRKKKEEWNVEGLVLKMNSLQGTRNSIKGVVINRRKDTISQATITFDLFDSDNAHIGVASATTDDFKPNTKWNFEVDTLGREVAGFKPKALTAF